MNVNYWLTINSRGNGRLTKTQPNTDWNEVSMALNVDIPDAIFKRPRLSAEVQIPKEAAQPQEITASVIGDFETAIKTATGMDVRITLVNEEDEPEE